MTIDLRRISVCVAAGAGLLALTTLSGHGPLRVSAAQTAESLVAYWPEPSRRMARMMIEKHGQPSRRSEDSLTWFGIYRGRRTVVHRTSDPANTVEQVILYRVPAAKVGVLALFDNRIKVNRNASEMSVRSESVRTNFLVLNLAHEVASGFRTAGEAQEFRERQTRLAAAGKSSRYREELIFEQPLTDRSGLFVLPSGVPAP